MGRSYREVAEAMELSVGSVHNIAKEPVERIEPVVREIRRRFAMKHWLLSDHILSDIHKRDLLHASLKEKAIASAILTDKAMELERAMHNAPPGPPAMPQAPHVEVRPECLSIELEDEHRMNTGDSGNPVFKMQIPPPERRWDEH
jgi:hypothetical protein